MVGFRFFAMHAGAMWSLLFLSCLHVFVCSSGVRECACLSFFSSVLWSFAGWATGIRAVEKFNTAAEIQHVCVGAFHTVVATSTGYVYTYGLNDRGQLGLGTAGISGFPLPRQPIVNLRMPIEVRQVDCGVDHTLLLDGAGRVFSWGSNKL